MQKSNQYGYTMIEVVATISILIMLITGMTKTVTTMFGKYKYNEVLNQIRDLRKTVNDRYAAIGDYSDLSAKLLIDEKIAPQTMVAGNILINSFGGQVYLAPAHTYGKNKSFEMQFTNLPKMVCIEAATINWRVDDTSTLVQMVINNKSQPYKWPVNSIGGAVKPGKNSLPMTIPMAQQACNNKDDKNLIIWEFQ